MPTSPKNPRKQVLQNAKRRVNNKSKKKVKTPNKGQEKRCVDNFRHLGDSEVETPLGYIDLLTKDYIVEFKIYTGAKSALGQVLCYAEFVRPKRKLMVVLFGKGLSRWKAAPLFVRTCARYNVEVFLLKNNYVYKDLKKILGE